MKISMAKDMIFLLRFSKEQNASVCLFFSSLFHEYCQRSAKQYDISVAITFCFSTAWSPLQRNCLINCFVKTAM